MELFVPKFGSELTGSLFELEHLRRLNFAPTSHELVFQQMKRLFHTLESVGSARIEGNNTTLAEYLEGQHDEDEQQQQSESTLEIRNIEAALAYIEACGTERPIDEMFIRELHQIVVKGLRTEKGGEGDAHAGQYRSFNVQIKGSKHRPPEAVIVPELMEDLIRFIHRDDAQQFDLVKIAQAHHRFVWIHPFGNGNGRTVRLFTYALLLRAGFKVDIAGRIVNPTAVFCSDRDLYYHYLSLADTATEEGMEQWCNYVLSGLLEEVKKVDQLGNHEYLVSEILVPSIIDAYQQGRIGAEEQNILLLAAKRKSIMSGDVEALFSNQSKATVSRKLKQLVSAQLLMPEKPQGRKYVLCFSNPEIMPSVVKLLGKKGFLPNNL